MAKDDKKSGCCQNSGKPTEDEVRTAVRSTYGKLALKDASCCDSAKEVSCSCGGLYSQTDIASLPEAAMEVSAGCGNPGAIASLSPGMTVLDLGSGGGIDVFIAANKVGSNGRALGVDATPEMIARARRTAKESGYDNVEFRLGEIEHLPVESDTIDVVISNCVINLSPDKEQVFREAFRVLKPGGKLAVSDIVLLRELPKQLSMDLNAWSNCVAGALSEQEYMGAMKKAGFGDITVESRMVYTPEQMTGGLLNEEKRARLEGLDLSNLVASYGISAKKPKK